MLRFAKKNFLPRSYSPALTYFQLTALSFAPGHLICNLLCTNCAPKLAPCPTSCTLLGRENRRRIDSLALRCKSQRFVDSGFCEQGPSSLFTCFVRVTSSQLRWNGPFCDPLASVWLVKDN